MNGKERVRCALDGRLPDRVPMGELAIDFDTVEKLLCHETYLRAKAKSTLALWEGRRDELAQSWKEDIVELYRKLDCYDIVNVNADACGVLPPRDYEPLRPKKVDDKTWIDREGRVYKYSEVTCDITLVEDRAEEARTYGTADFEDEAALAPDESCFEVVDYAAEKLKDRFILGPAGAEAGFLLLGGMEKGLMLYATDPEVVEAAIAKEVRDAEAADPVAIRAGTDAVIFGQDFAYNGGPMISPSMFRRLCLPSIQRRVERIKRDFGRYVIKHACGNNMPLMDSFLDAGYDCYQSIQTSAGMDLGTVKAEYGDRICLWGGLPLELLMGGNTGSVRDAVKRAVDTGAPNGRYIFGSSHSIAVGTDYDCFMAMLDTFTAVRDAYGHA